MAIESETVEDMAADLDFLRKRNAELEAALYEASRRARGEREIRLWVPDNPEDIEAVRSLARELCAKRSPKSL